MATPAAKIPLQTQATEPTYVFGADMSGDFSQGSAAVAARLFGADTDVGVGISGNAYAIPYRNSDGEMLSFGALGPHIASFLSHARAHPQESFMVARFGCEPGASDDATMVRHFSHVPPNCQLPGVWMRHIDPKMGVRLMVFDPFARFKDPYWQDKLKRYLSLNAATCNGARVELVSVGAARAIVANDMAAKSLGLKHRVFGANEGLFGADAASAAEMKAMWYSTHFLSLCDFRQTVQPQQFRVTAEAIRAGLTVDQLEVEA
ncbi:MAG: hypothetical protein IPG43_13150 [Proteobacteria bacterium]|nr:hypothetical protein [Pseudomonadota bacterium]